MAASVPTAPNKPKGINLYARFALAGALGCSVTHSAFTPVDVYVLPLALTQGLYQSHQLRDTFYIA